MKKRVTIRTSIPESLFEKVKAKADDKMITVSGIVRMLIKKGIDKI